MSNNIELAVKFLKEKPGYMKSSYAEIAGILGVSRNDVADAVAMIKQSSVNNPMKAEYEEFLKWREERAFKGVAKPKKNLPKPYNGGNPNNILVIADTHEPFCKKGYLEFCREQQEKWNCGTVVHIGDEVGLCAISQWERDPDGLSAESEAAEAHAKMVEWFSVFPTCYVAIGNHTARPFRMARTAGIPSRFIKPYNQAWNAPSGWQWAESWEFNGVLYTHGTGLSGANGAIKLASQYRQNCVIGHIHTEAGVQYNASKKDIVWGMQVGGAIDDTKYAFHYAKDQLKKSIIGCGIVLNGQQPMYIPMPL